MQHEWTDYERRRGGLETLRKAEELRKAERLRKAVLQAAHRRCSQWIAEELLRRHAEQQRIRIAEELRQAEEQRQAEIRRKAEERQIAEEILRAAKRKCSQWILEEMAKEEARQKAEELRKAEDRRKAEEHRRAEARRKEQQREAQEKIQRDARRKAKAKAEAEAHHRRAREQSSKGHEANSRNTKSRRARKLSLEVAAAHYVIALQSLLEKKPHEKTTTTPIVFQTFPWPTLTPYRPVQPVDIVDDTVEAFFNRLHETSLSKEEKKALLSKSRIFWHPDRLAFRQIVQRIHDPSLRKVVEKKAMIVSKIVNSRWDTEFSNK
ncbi:hypothetical protein BDV98DRAFT_134019 [Pterulicium gracile]|uniref:Uncharacterized protein n=1 Tax=Pterulicium gracile TaxID=1884261 RepID=A0A5C3QDE4_9AGAR|nr:hypothetical protein BDV98DRAFT_134019 [Pterula gracilis]